MFVASEVNIADVRLADSSLSPPRTDTGTTAIRLLSGTFPCAER